MWVANLCFKQYLANEVHQPLNRQGMSLLLHFNYDRSADHLGGCGDIEQEGFPFGRWHQDGCVCEEPLKVLEGFFSLGGPNEALCLPLE
jgi:hypothetical protein